MAGNTSSRGFASMDNNKQREIARKGGKAAHAKGTAHEFTSDEARAAGRKGGERVSANRAHMAEIGRLGGKRSASRRAQLAASGNGASGEDEADGRSNGRNANGHNQSAQHQGEVAAHHAGGSHSSSHSQPDA